MNRRRKFLISIVVVLGLAILIPYIHHHRLRAAVEACIAELKAKGEPMELSQVLPPTVSPEQNSAPIFLKATSLLDTNWGVLGNNPPPAMRLIAPGKAMIGWMQPSIRDRKTTNSWDEIAAALAEDDEALRLLRQIANHPAFDFNLGYSNGVDKIQILHLAPMKKAAQRLLTAAICDLHRGDTASAVTNVHATLSLVNGMSSDRVVISELVRMAIAQMTLSANWELLQSPNVTDKQLAVLQNEWASLEFIRAEENALAMERVIGGITLANWRSSNAELQRFFGAWERLGMADRQQTTFDKTKIKTKIFMWRYWWSYPDELRTMKGYQALLDAVRFARTNYSFFTAQQQLDDKLKKLLISTNNEDSVWFADPNKVDMHSMLSASVISLSRTFNRVMRAEAAKQLAVTAIALKRYQLRHGNYPQDLAALVPEILSDIPHDPADGQPLRYRLTGNGDFLLYSIGQDDKDDDGNPRPPEPSKSRNWINGRDWVWPQPAPPKEIQDFYEHPELP